MRTATVVLSLIFSLLAMPVGFLAAEAARPIPSAHYRPVPRIVVDRIRWAVEEDHDPHPTAVLVVRTSRQAAVSFDSGATVDSNQHVYYVVMRGHFVDTNAFIPPGHAFPRGNQVTLTIEPRQGMILDVGVETSSRSVAAMAAKLRRLGPVEDITALVTGRHA